MDLILKVYLVVVFSILALGIWISLPHSNRVHFLGVNDTRLDNDTCRYTWLGGIDYDSFVGDISVDNISIGHVPVGSVIHEGRCGAVVRLYMKDVKTYVQIYPKAGGI
jgi:hypothetical protein